METEQEMIDLEVIKQLLDLQKQSVQSQKDATISALKAENDQLKLRLMQMDIKLQYKLSDQDTIDTTTGVITRK